MSASRLDAVYRSILITKFFTKGWGKPDNLRRLFEFRKTVSNRDECFKLVERDYPITITKEETVGECRLLEGHFVTPLERYLPGIVPPAAQRAHFQALLPLRWPQLDYRPVCLHLAGTGDHYFWRRRNLMAKPLLKEAGIGAIILENPFYGLRKPSDQVRSSLHNVSDIFVMGGCLILESLVLFHWCERNSLGPLGVTGLSMGGHMASLAATNWPKPLVLVPCLSWSTASAVFLQGVMSHSINWDLLEDQYLSDGNYREKLSKMVTVVDEAFLAGKKFVRKVAHSIDMHTVAEDIANGDIKVSKMESLVNRKDEDLNNNNSEGVDGKVEDLTKSDSFNDDKSENLVNRTSDLVNNDRDIRNNQTCDNLSSNTKNVGKRKSDNLRCNKKESLKLEKSQNSSKDVNAVDMNNHTETVGPLQAVVDQDFGELRAELKKLSEAGHIKESLLVKLTSNRKFELDARDVEELNKLNKEGILTRKYSIGSLVNSESFKTNATSIESSQEISTKKMHQNLDDETIENVDSNEKLKQNLTKSTKLNVNATESKTNANKPDTDIHAHKLDTASLHEKQPNSPSNLVSEIKPVGKKSRNITELTSDLLSSIPFMSKPPSKKIDISKMSWRDREALQFMRGIMDECTHLSNFSVPFDTSLIIAVCAKHDAYVPREDVGALEEIWPGAEVRYVDAGHVSAYLLHQSMFRSCIIEAFERSKKKWKDGQHIA